MSREAVHAIAYIIHERFCGNCRCSGEGDEPSCITRVKQAILSCTMDEHEPVQVVELRISYRYATAHPWVVQAIGGFLSAYFMEYPGFRVQRHIEELESGTHLWVCEVPPNMKVLRLLKRLKEDIPPCHDQQIATDPPARPRYLIDCPE